MFVWRVTTRSTDILTLIFGGLCLVFLFYDINYCVLIIRLTQYAL
jgi:hypothetical protein